MSEKWKLRCLFSFFQIIDVLSNNGVVICGILRLQNLVFQPTSCNINLKEETAVLSFLFILENLLLWTRIFYLLHWKSMYLYEIVCLLNQKMLFKIMLRNKPPYCHCRVQLKTLMEVPPIERSIKYHITMTTGKTTFCCIVLSTVLSVENLIPHLKMASSSFIWKLVHGLKKRYSNTFVILGTYWQ